MNDANNDIHGTSVSQNWLQKLVSSRRTEHNCAITAITVRNCRLDVISKKLMSIWRWNDFDSPSLLTGCKESSKTLLDSLLGAIECTMQRRLDCVSSSLDARDARFVLDATLFALLSARVSTKWKHPDELANQLTHRFPLSEICCVLMK